SIPAHAMRFLHALKIRRQRLIVLWTPLVQCMIVKTLVAPRAQVFFIAPTRFLQIFVGPEPEPLLAHLGQRRSDDQRILLFQDSLVSQMIERGEELATRQIPGRTQNDKDMWVNHELLHPAGP